MSQNRRYSSREVEEPFRKMPSFKDASISVSDLDPFFKAIGFTCTPEQFQGYENYSNKLLDGRFPLDLCIKSLGSVDDAEELLKIHITAMDKDKDGFIDENEFKTILVTLRTHMGHDYPNVDYAQFVKEADTNQDGKISIDEAVEWFVKRGKGKK
ncbi:calmodulin [Folsomia candida]|uniref:Calmodulin-like protein 4 n=1 Tax=Folsomia candida TaxID=158441 RepID=A0A226EBA1_FOLCA|nr:calmodulin [Folsomia candida]OXA54845.1 Calmodulin-like protein 4 [Folsomia candida]